MIDCRHQSPIESPEIFDEVRPFAERLCAEGPLADRLDALAALAVDGVGWSVAAVGFFKLPLSPLGMPEGMHVHVWDSSVAWSEHFPHTHPWGFRSEVLRGIFRQRTYAVYEVPDGEHSHLVAKLDAPSGHHRAGSWSEARLGDEKVERYEARGAYYEQGPDHAHVADADDGTVTLIAKGPVTRPPKVFLPRDLKVCKRNELQNFLGWRLLRRGEIGRVRELVTGKGTT
jgi:hypothetical protein